MLMWFRNRAKSLYHLYVQLRIQECNLQSTVLSVSPTQDPTEADKLLKSRANDLITRITSIKR